MTSELIRKRVVTIPIMRICWPERSRGAGRPRDSPLRYGNGIAMALNKHQGIRAAISWNEEMARLVRAHNDANILVLPARFITSDEAKTMVDIFFSTSFDGGRHQRRIDKIPEPF